MIHLIVFILFIFICTLRERTFTGGIPSSVEPKSSSSMHIFKDDLRVHDHPELYKHISSDVFYPVYVNETPEHYNSWPFIVEALHDLNKSLIALGSGGLIILTRDQCKELGLGLDLVTCGHRNTLSQIRAPDTYGQFIKQFRPGRRSQTRAIKRLAGHDRISVLPQCDRKPVVPGGETAGLARLADVVSRKKWLATFNKPTTPYNTIEPSTSMLSPYLARGCLSVLRVYNEVTAATKGMDVTAPPVSFIGQLLWREYFYAFSQRPDFLRPAREVIWGKSPAHLQAFKEGRTGFPLVDAAMRQLRATGWIHHLARHLVACFLTRGDLWIDWRAGVAIFDEYLLDRDDALNNANWQWVSGSRWFTRVWQVYSPESYGKKNDPDGAYLRHWVPELKAYPAEYIYTPWKAPVAVQEAAGCIVGVDYPLPIVDHHTVSMDNISKFRLK